MKKKHPYRSGPMAKPRDKAKRWEILRKLNKEAIEQSSDTPVKK